MMERSIWIAQHPNISVAGRGRRAQGRAVQARFSPPLPPIPAHTPVERFTTMRPPLLGPNGLQGSAGSGQVTSVQHPAGVGIGGRVRAGGTTTAAGGADPVAGQRAVPTASRTSRIAPPSKSLRVTGLRMWRPLAKHPPNTKSEPSINH